MKRCRSIGTNNIVLGLTSFFIFLLVGCGIPTYINLDSNISWQREEATHVDGTQLSWTVLLDAVGIQKINAVDNGPGLKLFYTLSPDASKDVFAFESIPIESRFNTYFRKSSSGNGLDWNAGNTTAPGFYLFTPNGSSSTAPLSIVRPDPADVNDSKQRVLVGTFAIDVDTSGEFDFKDTPEMDLAIPKIAGTISFTIGKPSGPQLENFTELVLGIGAVEIPLRNYIAEKFPLENESDLHIDAADEDYFSYFSNPSGSKYIHVWASLYGGKGDFSNTYWSSLTYLGKIDL
jgi:hypothetical protein